MSLFWRFKIVLSVLFAASISMVLAIPQEEPQRRIDSLQTAFFQPNISGEDKEKISWEVFRLITQQFLYREGVPTLQKFLSYAEQPAVNDTLKAAIYFQWALVGSFTQGNTVSRHTEYFLKARDLSAKTGRYDLLINAYVQVLNNLYRAKAYDEVEQVGTEAMHLMETWDYRKQHVEIYNTLALAYEKQNKLAQALAIFDKGIALIQKQDASNIWHALLQGNKGSVLHQMGRLKEALPLLAFDVNTSCKWNDMFNAISSLSEIAEINAKLGRMSQARASMDTVFRWIKITGDDYVNALPACIKAYKRASFLYQKEGKLSEAIYYLQKAYQKEKEYDLLMLKAEALKIRRQYDLEKSESELKLAKTNNDLLAQQKNTREIIAIAAVAGLLLLSGLLTALFRQRNRLRHANLQIEEQLEEIRQNNKQLQKLDQFKRLLTGTIVHDLKNPLATIIQRAKEPTTTQAARRMMNMVLNILEVDKLEDLSYHADVQEVNLHQVLQQTLTELNCQTDGKALSLNCLIPENLIVWADAALTERIFVNLISNAIRFTPAEGSITVQSVPTSAQGTAVISVADTGIGIPPEALPHIFDKFFQVNPNQSSGNYRSNGLGLTFCKLAMEAQGGTIGVESKLNQGTTFFLTFVAKDNAHEESPITVTSKRTDNLIFLSANEQTYLQPFVEKLYQKELYELGEIRQILATIDAEYSPQVAFWVHQMQDAVIHYHEGAYKNLLSLVAQMPANDTA
ncbi:tetratricopeptide repeat-containing sensor histidine kinase [Rhodoflexus caldus]|uniref:tetratricopeptide repeat-containing sensor histidine kinase n=1 Tax=Rhodoflexus caldus TaxID=2891236 RepID=UPI00202A3ACA|nr:tetratricopeptide repeat-containing sensor histidine kinase [Rhodoflexus caldus]